jgi:hypothetical protein
MAAGRDPTDRVIDLVIAVPVSIVAAVRQLIPVGVTRLEQKVGRDLDLIVRYARRAAPSMPRRSRGAARSRVSVDDATDRAVRADADADVVDAHAIDDVVASTADEVPADHLPIEGYDQLSARQIVDRLGALTGPELALIAQHEHGHRRRQTILLRIAQLT